MSQVLSSTLLCVYIQHAVLLTVCSYLHNTNNVHCTVLCTVCILFDVCIFIYLFNYVSDNVYFINYFDYFLNFIFRNIETSVVTVMVSIAAFQAVDSSSITGRRNFVNLSEYKCKHIDFWCWAAEKVFVELTRCWSS